MYSYEINELLIRNNFRISTEVYWEICKSSQVYRIKYNPYGDYIELWTSDGNYWKITVYDKKEKV